MSLFLSSDDVIELTAIKRGSNGLTRQQMQCDFLRQQGIPFFTNRIGEPKVAIAFINGTSKEPPKQSGWSPKFGNA